MRKLIYILSSAAVVVSMTLSSCTKDFKDINTDPNKSTSARPSQLLAPALVSILTTNQLRNRNLNNELMQVSVDMSDQDGRVFRYEVRGTWADYTYNNWYTALTNLKMIDSLSRKTGLINPSYQGISYVLQAWVYSMLTDTYGDVPFTESNKGLEGIMEPKFDSQKDVYFGIFKMLDSANVLLAKDEKMDENNGDPIYNGSVSRWRKFGNSLYLRLLLRISGKAEVQDQVVAKFKEIAETPSKFPIMTTIDESAILRWTGVGPYTSPLLSVREQDFRQPGVAEFFLNTLSAWGDPRIDQTQSGFTSYNRFCIATYNGGLVGVPSGYLPGDGGVKKSYFYSINQTPAPTLQNDQMTGQILTYGEVRLILAEAAAKGFISSKASDHYRLGVEASIKQWLGTNWKNKTVDQYLIDADMAWSDADPLEEKMEMIHKQKYYTLFLCDMQQWFEYRRTGHPILPKGPGLQNNGEMPARLNYPVYVQSTNPTNYKLAVAAQGPDNINTKVWWQKP
ncbi:SusD/RagB family nutrient-binding outer membrane lipoprotein [Chitinophaga lutea]